jgi:uncharacterized membrane protein YkvA (DUF1232 family)
MGARERIAGWVAALERELAALYLAGRDARTPRVAKLAAVAVVAYALSPIDLIPDFIPVLGYLDDLLIVPLGIALAVRLVPHELMQEFRTRAKEISMSSGSRAGLAIVIGLWLIAAAAGAYWIWWR